jgi:hypothetical protein
MLADGWPGLVLGLTALGRKDTTGARQGGVPEVGQGCPRFGVGTWVLGATFLCIADLMRDWISGIEGLRHYYARGHLHFMIFSCYRRLPLLKDARSRDTNRRPGIEERIQKETQD